MYAERTMGDRADTGSAAATARPRARKRSRVWLELYSVALVLVGIAGGIVIMGTKIFPHQLIVDTYLYLRPTRPSAESMAILREELPFTLKVRSPEAAAAARHYLVDHIWGQPEPPRVMPSRVVRNWTEPQYRLAGAARVDRIELSQEYGIDSIMLHFIPERPNNRLVLYHQGHEDEVVARAYVERLLRDGYSVMSLNMPLWGLNPKPRTRLPGLGTFRLDDHQKLAYARPAQGRPMRYFLDPVLAALNYVEREYHYDDVAMMGLSGGGWTTTLAAAIDSRIRRSFPVAGTSPMTTWSASNWGDYEQSVPALYSYVSYLDLYVLGTLGGRRQFHILNRYDNCCFVGEQLDAYRGEVANVARSLGGSFDGMIDDSHREHVVSDVAMDRIIAELAR